MVPSAPPGVPVPAASELDVACTPENPNDDVDRLREDLEAIGDGGSTPRMVGQVYEQLRRLAHHRMRNEPAERALPRSPTRSTGK